MSENEKGTEVPQAQVDEQMKVQGIQGGLAINAGNEEYLDFSVQIAKKPRFEPLSIYHDLCLGTLENVEVVYRTIPELNAKGEASTYEFAGKTIPELKFTFNNYKVANVDEVEREFVKTYSVIGWDDEADDTKKDNIKLVYDGMNTQLMYLVQYFSSITKNPARPLIPKINISATTDERIVSFDKFFTGFANWFKTGKAGKEVYKTAEGKSLILIVKLIAVTKANGGGKQYKVLDFPRYVQEGFIEIFKSLKHVPGIKLKPGESINLDKVALAPNAQQNGADQSVVNTDDLSPEMKKMMGIE